MEKDLQKHLFLHGMRSLTIPGWDVLEENDIIAFKSPSKAHFIDFVYGKVTLENYEKAKNFYSSKPFMWLINDEQEGHQLQEFGFEGPDVESEMVLSLSVYVPPKYPLNIQIRVASAPEDYNQWLGIAAEWLGANVKDVDDFYTPWIKKSGSTPFLVLLNGEAAATSLLYANHDHGAIYSLSVRLAFRGLGVATIATHACLEYAKNKNLSKIVLYASPMGKPIYEKIGFKMVQELYGYSYGEIIT